MPPAIADSDDDSDMLIETDSLLPEQIHPAETTSRSTGSTERTRNEIRNATRDLLAPTADATGSMAAARTSAAGSPPVVTAGLKRRHSAALDQEASVSPEQRVKRSKTTQKTYASKQRSSAHPPADPSAAVSEVQDNSDAPPTFSEHSRLGSSGGGLPSGTIRAEFADHEPNVLFGDSGTTAADGSSSQRRMLERAVSERQVVGTSASRLGEEGSARSSSFPWPGTQRTPGLESPAAVEGGVVLAKSPREEGDHAVREQEIEVQSGVVGAPPVSVTGLPSISKSSPRVQISLPGDRELVFTTPAAEHPQKRTRGRKSRPQGPESEPLNSEELAIGHPRERYVPRPSRRRATQVVEPADYSVPPERAAKAKRAKSAGGVMVGGMSETFEAAAAMKAVGDEMEIIEDTTASPMVAVKVVPPEKTVMDEEAAAEPTTTETVQVQPAHATMMGTSQEAPPPTQKPDKDDEIFVRPTPKPKATSRVKRSQTTIFEDHVDFGSSQRTPSLSQQQAKRKSALQGLGAGPIAANTKKRRKIVDDDDDDEEEDEKATAAVSSLKKGEEAPDELKTVPKKRAGRPSNDAALQAKTNEEAPQPKDSQGFEDDARVDGAPKKPARMRSRKVSCTAPAESVDKATEPSKGSATAIDTTPATPTVAASDTAARPPAAATQEPTPSPDKVPTVKATTKLPSRSSPISHSPLKSSLAVPLRVGLNRKQRIPSLLRTIRPAKK
ncbi:hypothetical protein LTR53_015311 [Teratosphaeriaceae sp. CCFEE 6253]|nr:hypothetical protein LTR53_015311 [Teratosphaeriaceae sp. CCFEE 6253]